MHLKLLNLLYKYSDGPGDDHSRKSVTCVFFFLCVQPGGSLFITTINKTNLSFALGIVVAEQLLRIVPRGTHEWEKFISPVELERLLESSKEPKSYQIKKKKRKEPPELIDASASVSLPPSDGFSVQSVQGMLYNPLSGAWSWTSSTAINYALHAVKVRDDVQPEGGEVEEEEESHRTDPQS